MFNEFGVKLNQFGYAPSVVDPFDDECCFLCGKGGDLVRHEIYFGAAFRKKSKALGCWVRLCPECHYKLHNSKPELDKQLKQIGQLRAMAEYDWTVEDFRERFGKSYVEIPQSEERRL